MSIKGSADVRGPGKLLEGEVRQDLQQSEAGVKQEPALQRPGTRPPQA